MSTCFLWSTNFGLSDSVSFVQLPSFSWVETWIHKPQSWQAIVMGGHHEQLVIENLQGVDDSQLCAPVASSRPMCQCAVCAIQIVQKDNGKSRAKRFFNQVSLGCAFEFLPCGQFLADLGSG